MRQQIIDSSAQTWPQGAKKLGMRFGNWLTVEEARFLWQLPNMHTAKGKNRICANDSPVSHQRATAFAWMSLDGVFT
jgi:hypothetical protein